MRLITRRSLVQIWPMISGSIVGGALVELWGLLWGPRMHSGEFQHILVHLDIKAELTDFEGVVRVSAIQSIS